MRSARLLVAVSLAALACTACGSSGHFEGSPAPPAVKAQFKAFNKQAQRFAKAHGRKPQPAIIVNQAHGVLRVRTADGSVNLWAAPERAGGTCSYVVSDPERNAGGVTSCPFLADSFPQGLSWTQQPGDHQHAYQVIDGYALHDASTILVRLAGGSSNTLPVVEHYFLGAFPSEAKIISLTDRNAHGDILGPSRVH